MSLSAKELFVHGDDIEEISDDKHDEDIRHSRIDL